MRSQIRHLRVKAPQVTGYLKKILVVLFLLLKDSYYSDKKPQKTMGQVHSW